MLCQPKDRLSGRRPISFCVKINGSDIDYMRRNYDSPSPGEFRQAIGAMEASIQVRCKQSQLVRLQGVCPGKACADMHGMWRQRVPGIACGCCR